MITLVEDPASSVKVVTAIPDPINMAFDCPANRLLLFETANKLAAIQMSPDGLPNPTAITRLEARQFGLQSSKEGSTKPELVIQVGSGAPPKATGVALGNEETTSARPQRLELSTNYPNPFGRLPFNAQTVIAMPCRKRPGCVWPSITFWSNAFANSLTECKRQDLNGYFERERMHTATRPAQAFTSINWRLAGKH